MVWGRAEDQEEDQSGEAPNGEGFGEEVERVSKEWRRKEEEDRAEDRKNRRVTNEVTDDDPCCPKDDETAKETRRSE
jgi:hypothetical protein